MASFNSSTQVQGTLNELPVLIIGAGLAGLTVALHMAENQPVILMAKRGLGEAATAWAQGGIAAAIGKDDSPKIHFEDTIKASSGLSDEKIVKIITDEAASIIKFLEEGVNIVEISIILGYIFSI